MSELSISGLPLKLQVLAKICDKNNNGKLDSNEIFLFQQMVINLQDKISVDKNSKTDKLKTKGNLEAKKENNIQDFKESKLLSQDDSFSKIFPNSRTNRKNGRQFDYYC